VAQGCIFANYSLVVFFAKLKNMLKDYYQLTIAISFICVP